MAPQVSNVTQLPASRRLDSHELYPLPDVRHFLRTSTFTVARLHFSRKNYELEAMGYSDFSGLTIAPALAPCKRLSPHTAQSKRFPNLASLGMGLGGPEDALRIASKTIGCGRTGDPLLSSVTE